MNIATSSSKPVLRALACALATLGSVATAAPFDVKHMDRDVHPGHDFYAYCAGCWMRDTEIPADKSSWGAFEELQQDNMVRIKGLLEETAAAGAEPGSIRRKVGDFFLSGMDVDAIEAARLKPLQPQIDRIDAVKTLDALMDEVAYAHMHIGSPLFRFSVSGDEMESDRNVFSLQQGGLSLPTRDYYFDERFATFRDGLKEHIAKVLQLAGQDEESAIAAADTVLAVETALAEVSKRPQELRDPLANYNKMTIDEAVARFDGLPLRRYLAAIAYPVERHPNIVVEQPEFYEALGRLLNERPLEDWKTYLHWQALRYSASYLSADFENEQFRFYGSVLNGVPEMEPRWQRVANAMDAYIGFGVGQLYTERYFPPEVKAELESMCALMSEVMADRIRRLDWMTDATKEKALEKLATFKVLVGYPDEWRDYGSMVVEESSYYGNVLRAANFEAQRLMNRIGTEVDKDEFWLTPQTVNAYINPTTNRMAFLAGILQPPYFDPNMDAAVNWGGIGAIIGHEMTHAFDDRGRQYDAQGNLNDWWTEADAQQFEQRAEKLVAQYNSYEPVPGHFVNGSLTLGENIADLGGLSIGFEAFRRSLQGKPEPEPIDGLTANQRFFIAWAQAFREKVRESAMIRILATDPHAPGRERAFGPMRNMQEFIDAFGIQEGDPLWLSPEERAVIW